jgi:hypothetical protein
MGIWPGWLTVSGTCKVATLPFGTSNGMWVLARRMHYGHPGDDIWTRSPRSSPHYGREARSVPHRWNVQPCWKPHPRPYWLKNRTTGNELGLRAVVHRIRSANFICIDTQSHDLDISTIVLIRQYIDTKRMIVFDTMLNLFLQVLSWQINNWFTNGD